MADARAFAAASAIALPALLVLARIAWTGGLRECWAALTRTEALPAPSPDQRARELVTDAARLGRARDGVYTVDRIGGRYRVTAGRASITYSSAAKCEESLARRFRSEVRP